MTRFSIVLVAVSCFAVCACERHPIPGETLVTHTHGSNGAPEAHQESEAAPSEVEKKQEATPAKTGEEKKAPAGEEKPTFFPEKK
jgi:hypothetical protein